MCAVWVTINMVCSILAFVEFETGDQLHQDPNDKIEFSRSYKCISEQLLTFEEDFKITPLVNISQFQAQAFSFRNKTTGEFDNGN